VEKILTQGRERNRARLASLNRSSILFQRGGGERTKLLPKTFRENPARLKGALGRYLSRRPSRFRRNWWSKGGTQPARPPLEPLVRLKSQALDRTLGRGEGKDFRVKVRGSPSHHELLRQLGVRRFSRSGRAFGRDKSRAEGGRGVGELR